MIKIAVISDLHVGENIRSDIYNPYKNDIRVNMEEDEFIKHFKEFILNANIKPDFLVIPGDISETAHPLEFSSAFHFIDTVGDILGVDKSKIIFIPGNHDVSWNIMKTFENDNSGFGHKHKFLPYLFCLEKFASIYQTNQAKLVSNNFFNIWEFDNIIFVGYNSALLDGPNEINHPGDVRKEDLDLLNTELSLLDNNKIKVFVIHHHLYPYTDPIYKKDFSIISNSEELLKFISQNKFDLIIHGHKHFPRFKTISEDYCKNINILLAGSFSCKIDSIYSGKLLNQFHMIEIDGIEENNKCIYGIIKSWAYLISDGWVNSKEYYGMDHENYFGKYIHDIELVKILNNILCQKNQGVLLYLWENIIIDYPDLIYNKERFLKIAYELKDELNISVFDNNGQMVILHNGK